MNMSSEKKLRIFLVEDSEIYSMMLDYKLQDIANYRFTIYETAEEALENLYVNPDCIILDYYLPGMNGLEALKNIKSKQPNIPVIILTSQNDVQVALDVMKAGASEYISKNALVVETLYETINKICEQRNR